MSIRYTINHENTLSVRQYSINTWIVSMAVNSAILAYCDTEAEAYQAVSRLMSIKNVGTKERK